MSKTNVIDEPTPDNLMTFLPFACARLGAPFRVTVKSQTQEEYVSKACKKESIATTSRKSRTALAAMTSQMPLPGSAKSTKAEPDSMSLSVPDDEDDSSEIYVLYAVTDSMQHLTELSIAPLQEVPRLLMKIISLCIPFNIYLNKLTMRCHFASVTFYETVQMVNTSHITELVLDDSRLAERNYHIVLEYETHLQLLSLARCNLTDDDCALLVSKLSHPTPASKTLNTLILSSNFISNTGASHIAQVLRSNRSLMYLNISGNRIGDTGAMDIFRSLVEFPLNAEEIGQKRRRTLYYLKVRKEVYQKCYKQLMATSAIETSDDRSSKRRPNPGILRRRQSSVTAAMPTDVAANRAEKMTAEVIGVDVEPYRAEATFNRANIVYSKGNLTLAYLNLAYNYLGYPSVVKLVEVLRYQAMMAKYPDLGLVGLQLDGNELPRSGELEQVSELLARALQVRLTYASPQVARRTERRKK